MSGLIHQILLYLEGLGYWGIFIGLMVEVIPNELLLAYAGYLVSKGEITFLGAIVCAVIGGTLAQIVLYAIGRYGGRPFLEKYGKYLLIKKHHLDVAESWFNRYGTGMIFTARFVPIVRHAISIPGGMARMSLGRFTLYTGLALIPYSLLYVYLGIVLKDNWEQIDEYARPYLVPVIGGAVVLTLLYVVYQIYRKRKAGAKHGDAGERSTAHQLRYLGKEYRVLNSRRVRGGGGLQEFDHIVVGPNGVFHIDSKHWSGDITFTSNGLERSKGGHQEDPTSQMYRHEFVMKELLKSSNLHADVVGVLCFTHPHSKLTGKSPAFATVKLDRLLHTIKSHKPKKTLTSGQIAEIEKLIKDNSVK
ncbi:VTT domain-containing protein [Paenibacillus athensensis]|uniref:NERD domain-containing protein n=1 Tax=Paenibacillus athensensis TaxID=1967502 RepID=A0A4Y8Q2H1_9BACL|nr:VTT domain-containing protein [Paenibacillus athensensis]